MNKPRFNPVLPRPAAGNPEQEARGRLEYSLWSLLGMTLGDWAPGFLIRGGADSVSRHANTLADLLPGLTEAQGERIAETCEAVYAEPPAEPEPFNLEDEIATDELCDELEAEERRKALKAIADVKQAAATLATNGFPELARPLAVMLAAALAGKTREFDRWCSAFMTGKGGAK